ncbi:MAG: PAS domain-containing protein [Clostridia bacterium]|nr:PAS domain-containing protein [Clostridia bacterium]
MGDIMENMIENTEEILENHISGFHKYVFETPARVTYVSKNLCDMTGFSKDELSDEKEDGYVLLIYPDDKGKYCSFINSFADKEQTATLQYRIVKKDGTLLYVKDTVVSKKTEDGKIIGYSVLSDITELKKENESLRFLNDTVPCGIIRFTCEKQPRVTYINDRMQKMLRFPEVKAGEMDYEEIYKDNIYLIIPIEDRRRFHHLLKHVYSKDESIAGEITILRCDGTKAYLYGWVSKRVNEHGQEEFQSVCMDITEKYRMKKENEKDRYISALAEVYDKIFEYNFLNNTVRYMYGHGFDVLRQIKNIPMQLKDGTEHWIDTIVFEEDRDSVRMYFEKIYQSNLRSESGELPQIKFRAVSRHGDIDTYMGIFIAMDESVGLFCCRAISSENETDSLRNENISLRTMNESMHDLVMRFSEGLVAFEIKGNYVKPLYSSENVRRFFGYSKEEWIPMTEKGQPLEQFISKCGIKYETVQKLLEENEAEFTYFDIKSNAERRIKAICSRKLEDSDAPRYVMLHNLDNRSYDVKPTEKSRVYIRTFGYFDVFVDGKPILFRNKKSKELFALLVDRRGGFVSSEEAISFLWEDEEANSVTLARYRKVALRLKNILEEYGISDTVEAIDGKRRIVTEKVGCDLYEYLSDSEKYAQLFKGSYLTNYSWGEVTLGELLGN